MPEGVGYGVVRKRKRPNKLSSREIGEKFHGKGKKPKKKDPPKSRSDIRRPTAEDLSDMVRRRTKAGAKTEGKVKKTKKTPRTGSIPQSTYDKGMNRIKEQIEDLDEYVHDSYRLHPYIGYDDSEAKKRKSKALKEFIRSDKKYRKRKRK